MRRIVFAASLGLFAVLLAAPAHAASSHLGKIVVLNGRTTVAQGEVANAVVVFHGRTIVDGRVNGSVVVFDGQTRISGDVRDNVVVFRGRVEVTDGAHIGGDLVTNGTPVVATGARIDGQRKHVSNLQFASYSWLARLLVWLAYTLSILLLGLLMVALLPGPMESAARAARSVGPSIGWGFVLLFGLPIAAVLVMVTLVGIPLGLSALLALWFLFTLGYTVGAFAVGRWIMKPPAGRMKAFLAGWGVLRVLALAPFLGGIVWTIVAVLGLGATTVAVWRSRAAVRSGTSLPPPPAAPATRGPVAPPAPAAPAEA
ncbi:MAG: hypothetical protein ACJ77A_13910 [Actinomycetota bacterium]